MWGWVLGWVGLDGRAGGLASAAGLGTGLDHAFNLPVRWLLGRWRLAGAVGAAGLWGLAGLGLGLLGLLKLAGLGGIGLAAEGLGWGKLCWGPGLGWRGAARSCGLFTKETEIGLFENGKVCPEKMSFRMANSNKHFLFISFLRV